MVHHDVLFIIFVGEFVVQYKFTVLLMPNGPLKITGLPFESELYESDKSIQDEEIKVCIFLIIKGEFAVVATAKICGRSLSVKIPVDMNSIFMKLYVT